MPWTDYIWSQRRSTDIHTDPSSQPNSGTSTGTSTGADPTAPRPPLPTRISSLLASSWSTTTTHLPLVQTLAPTLVLTSVCLAGASLYRTRLRRIPTAPHIPAAFLRRRRVYGYVTSVGDGDNFRLYHTPGGRWAGWGWWPTRRAYLPVAPARGLEGRKVGKGGIDGKGLVGGGGGDAGSGGRNKLETIHVRLAGVDAPELPHFGRPGQAWGDQSLATLRRLVLGRYVRVELWRRDQYERVVGTAWVGAEPGAVLGLLEGMPRTVRLVLAPVEGVVRVTGWAWRWIRGTARVDVGLRMLEEGAAGVYEAKSGSEFGGAEREAVYRAAEAKAKNEARGMWGGKSGGEKRSWWDWFTGNKTRVCTSKVETPREFKTRMKDVEEGKATK